MPLSAGREPPLLFERRRYVSEHAFSFDNAWSKLCELSLEFSDPKDSLVALSDVANERSFSTLADSRLKSDTETPDGIRDISARCLGDGWLLDATEGFSTVAAATLI